MKWKRRWPAAAFALAAALGASGLAFAAAQPSGADAIRARQASFKKMGAAFKAVNEETRAQSPDAAKLRANADIVADLSKQLPKWFPAGSGPGAGAPSAAKAEIWSKTSDFQKKAADFQAAAAKLHATPTTDIAAMTAATRAIGQQCTSCHAAFREKDKK